MDPRLLGLYRSELNHLREVGSEFAAEFPRIASRLGMEGNVEVSDPYVERLLEGFAFMAARVQLKLDAEQPRLIAYLLEAIYPNFLSPVPSMMVAGFKVDTADPNLQRGHVVPRGSAVISEAARGQDTHCEFRTAHDVTLWPVELQDVRYFSYAADLPLTQLPQARASRGGLRIRLRCGGGLRWCDLPRLDRLDFYISAADAVAFRLHELVTGAVAGTLVRSGDESAGLSSRDWRGPHSVQQLGFDAHEALLPESLRAFSGYRLLQEAAAMPQRLLFFAVNDLAARLSSVQSAECELIIFLQRGEPNLEALVDARSLALNCTPAINLFRKRLDRIVLGPGSWEYHVVPDRQRPMDFEVHSVESVTGYGTGPVGKQEFTALYSTYHAPELHSDDDGGRGHYTVRREPRLLSPRQRKEGSRSSYIGDEVFLSLVDPRHAPYHADLRQLSVLAWVSNRDLPTLLPQAGPAAHEGTSAAAAWRLESPGPVLAVQCLQSPTRPSSRLPVGELGWNLVNHLTLNHLSLIDASPEHAAAALRTTLRLYAPHEDAGWLRQVEGVRALKIESVVRRLPHSGPLTFGTGVLIELELDELAFQGTSAYLFASVLERYFARHAAINSYTQLSLRTPQRGLVKVWRPMAGRREII